MAAYLLLLGRGRNGRRVVAQRPSDPLDSLTDEEVVSRYRLNKRGIQKLVQLIGGGLERPTKRSKALTPLQQVLTALRFFATGTFQSAIGDLHGISQPAASRAISAVAAAIAASDDPELAVSFPHDPVDVRRTQQEFFRVAGFPRVLGCLDGTMVPILAPHDDEYLYVCRKGYHAINVQAVCDARLLFTNVVCQFPGSTHDSFVWRQSGLGTAFESGDMPSGFILGDSAYVLRPWLMTPKLHVASTADAAYNAAHMKTRNLIERAFGVLKSRFRCLHKSGGCLMYSPEASANIILACCRLHNFCIREGMPDVEVDACVNNCQDVPLGEYPADGVQCRERLINERFA
ncbi:putative nuclease HARBI1 [Lingula anatina]|uniref:Putative nuclease HARBI1 n=1 Tax=Lingula anatina TaxID=7574 RepID=A0A1S3JYC9_LINAN|nr:putative nuclease HARBI1 [Lingula anatina]|eukprot:XP_013415046.1 putative nuclease HARBI1 [Lingula anatina]